MRNYVLALLAVTMIVIGPMVALGSYPSPDAEGSTKASGPWDRTEWKRYRNLDDTYQEIFSLGRNYPSICRVYNLSGMYPYEDSSPRLTYRGRTFWGLKISDNPGSNESDEPEVLYISMTHAREWISNEVLMFYINYLLRNYGYNSTVNNVVNNTQMWFIPVVNPDGFQESIDKDDFNQSGGLQGWRKNCNETNGMPGFQNNGSGSGDGVDPNRNFGYEWDSGHSSTDPDNIVYRGSAPFSEPETQIIRELTEERNFSIAISYHSFSQLNLYPWAHTTSPAEDDSLLFAIANKMSEYNGYTPTKGSSLYPTSGDFNDYMYGTFGIPVFTVELDTVFIPPLNRISHNCHINLGVNFLMARLAHDPYSVYESGINGTVKDFRNRSVTNASINITGNGRSVLIDTNGENNFNITLEPGYYRVSITAEGGLYNNTTVRVPSKGYLKIYFVLKESNPPMISKVSAFVEGFEVSSVEWRSDVKIEVEEASEESNLTGWINITSRDAGYSHNYLPLNESAEGYHAIWQTAEAKPGYNYDIEAVLVDFCGNRDSDGSTVGPDLTLPLVDTTPPGIESFRLIGVGGPVYERGQVLEVEMNITGTETWEIGLEGGMIIESGGGFHIEKELIFSPENFNYFSGIDTGFMPLGEFRLRAWIVDPFDNINHTDNITFHLIDTISPEYGVSLTAPSSYIYEAGNDVEILITPHEDHSNLTPWVKIFDPEGNEISEISNYSWSNSWGSFILVWNSTDVRSGTYGADAFLSDEAGNWKQEGLSTGLDIEFTVMDYTPPNIGMVLLDGEMIEPGHTTSKLVGFELLIRPEGEEVGLSCSLKVESENSDDPDILQLEREEDGSFKAQFNISTFGLGLMGIEIELTDASGNTDPDGWGPGIDLTVELTRNMPRIVELALSIEETEYIWGPGETGYILDNETLLISSTIEELLPGDTFRYLKDGEALGSETSVEIGESGTTFSTEYSSTLEDHNFKITLLVNTVDGSDLESSPVSVYVGRHSVDGIKDIDIDSFLDGGDEIWVNLTWTPPVNCSKQYLYVFSGDGIPEGIGDPHAILDPEVNRTSVRILRENVTFLIISILRPFPDDADRDVTIDSHGKDDVEEGVSWITFTPEARSEEIPGSSEDGSDIWIIILIVVILILLIIIVIFYYLNRHGKGSIEE